jgi:hypothetical protein
MAGTPSGIAYDQVADGRMGDPRWEALVAQVSCRAWPVTGARGLGARLPGNAFVQIRGEVGT